MVKFVIFLELLIVYILWEAITVEIERESVEKLND